MTVRNHSIITVYLFLKDGGKNFEDLFNKFSHITGRCKEECLYIYQNKETFFPKLYN